MPKAKRFKFLANGVHAKLFTGLDLKQTLQAAIDETRRQLSVRLPCPLCCFFQYN